VVVADGREVRPDEEEEEACRRDGAAENANCAADRKEDGADNDDDEADRPSEDNRCCNDTLLGCELLRGRRYFRDDKEEDCR